MVAGHAKRKAAEAAASGGTAKKKNSARKLYDRTNEYKALKKALELAIRESGGAPDEIQLSQIDEYMDLWVQRKLLRDEVRTKGVTVYDERGRAMENRSISLGIQTSKLMAALRKELGLVKEPMPILGTDGEEDEEL